MKYIINNNVQDFIIVYVMSNFSWPMNINNYSQNWCPYTYIFDYLIDLLLNFSRGNFHFA